MVGDFGAAGSGAGWLGVNPVLPGAKEGYGPESPDGFIGQECTEPREPFATRFGKHFPVSLWPGYSSAMWICRANSGYFFRFGVTSMSQKQMTRGLLGASLLAAGACSHLPFHRHPAAAGAPAPAPVAQVQTARKPAPVRPVKGPTDAEIAAVLLAASNTDISYARLAPTRAQSPDTKDYAAQMAADHASVNRMVNEMLVRIKLNPEDNAASLAFRDESATRRDVLRQLDGRAFDAAYLMNEVTSHTKLLASIDNSLLPSARSPELKNLLTTLRPAVAAHLAHAQELQASLASK